MTRSVRNFGMWTRQVLGTTVLQNRELMIPGILSINRGNSIFTVRASEIKLDRVSGITFETPPRPHGEVIHVVKLSTERIIHMKTTARRILSFLTMQMTMSNKGMPSTQLAVACVMRAAVCDATILGCGQIQRTYT
jgi:hypothetical protein